MDLPLLRNFPRNSTFTQGPIIGKPDKFLWAGEMLDFQQSLDWATHSTQFVASLWQADLNFQQGW